MCGGGSGVCVRVCVRMCVHSTTLHGTVVDVANLCTTKQWFFSDKPTTFTYLAL